MIHKNVDIVNILPIVDKMRRALPLNTGAVEAEYAALLFYCNVAEGVGKFPEATRLQRAVLVAQRGAEALVHAIGAVGDMTEAQVAAELKRLSS